jgi:hypothetical protein
VSALGYRLKARMRRPMLAPRLELPTNPGPSARLVGGPALAGFVVGLPSILLFAAAMLVGMAAATLVGMLLHRVTASRQPVPRSA